jgi:peroxiredoxin
MMFRNMLRRMRDNDLILLRLPAEVPVASSDSQPQKRGPKPITQSRIERNGIKAGTIAPEFTLPDIYGRSVSLEEYRGRRVLLVFSDPHCGPCNDLAPHLMHAHRRRRGNTTEIVVISRGDVEENRRKAEASGFEFPVLLQERSKLARKYGIFMTPVAFLIGEDGRTTRDVAIGGDQIQSLLLEEFPRNPLEGLVETVDDISRVFSSPIRRRDAFRLAGRIAAGAVISAIGLEKIALAACNAGFTACGTACCDNATQRCCSVSQSRCCSLAVACCAGKCCAPTEICVAGQCRQQVQP